MQVEVVTREERAAAAVLEDWETKIPRKWHARIANQDFCSNIVAGVLP